ncbi:trypsin-like peptidase domain-containing protein [Rubellimicrobium arenae]|uniref:trypsin-like peptidase domain-containing protein n=1 Tax=Rubellimicrobium arenae TaxID=2817372 RepID=UPI001B3066FD|nr:trypsin-like peptidase domain-containing protein [Rubellimicrobium arenae]
MTPIHISQGRRAGMLAGVALSALCLVAPLGATPVMAQTAETPAQEQTTLSQVAEAAAQSVVTITVTASTPDLPRSGLDPDDNMMREFLRRFGDSDQPIPDLPFAGPELGAGPVQTVGSGFIADPEGLIVTADALLANADRVEVTLPDGSSEPAEIIGRDAQTGIALLRVEGQQLPALSWGTSEELDLGESLPSVGRTEDFGPVLVTGLLAGRSTNGERLLIDDAPASALVGAPVLDNEGRVIGIRTNAGDATQTGATVALAAEVARDVVDELAQSGAVARGYLGVQIQPVTADIASALGLDQPEGVLVAGVQPDTPAAAAGLRDGDVIMSLDGEAVAEPEVLSRSVASREPGEKVRLQVWRSEEVVDLTATLAALPSETATPDSDAAPLSGVAVPDLGLTLQELTPDLREEWGLTESTQGVAVLGVEDPTRSDVQDGDVIVSVHRVAVETVEDVQKAVETARTEGRSSVLLLIDRAGARSFVAVPLVQS